MTDHHGKTTTGSAVDVCPPADAKRCHHTNHCTTVQRSVNQDDGMVSCQAVVAGTSTDLDDKTKPTADTVVTTINTSVDAQNFQNKNFNQNLMQVTFKDLLPLKTQELALIKKKARTMTTPTSKPPSAPKKYSAFARASSLPTFQPGPEGYETPMNQGV